MKPNETMLELVFGVERPVDERYEMMQEAGYPGLEPYFDRCIMVWKYLAQMPEINDIVDAKREVYKKYFPAIDDRSYCAICQYIDDMKLLDTGECHRICPLMRLWPDGCCADGPYHDLIHEPTIEKVKTLLEAICENHQK